VQLFIAATLSFSDINFSAACATWIFIQSGTLDLAAFGGEYPHVFCFLVICRSPVVSVFNSVPLGLQQIDIPRKDQSDQIIRIWIVGQGAEHRVFSAYVRAIKPLLD
jgi:hypothetical protein